MRARGRGWPIAGILGVGLGLFVALAVGAELVVGYVGARSSAYNLVRDHTVLMLDALVERILHHLQPAVDQAAFLERQITGRYIDVADPERVIDALTLALAGTPQVASLTFFSPDFKMVGVSRAGRRIEPLRAEFPKTAENVLAAERLAAAVQPYWGEVRRIRTGETVINLRTPIRRDGKYIGGIVSAISILDLSALLAEIGSNGPGRPFVLLGRDQVLAHPGYVFGLPTNGAPQRTLPTVTEYGDPVLANLWSPSASQQIERFGRTEARYVDPPGDDRRVVLYREIYDLGDRPWIVGTQFKAVEIGAELQRLYRMVYVGLAVLVAAVGAAVLLGHWFARPIRRFAEAADAMRRLDFAALPSLPRSRFREVDSAAMAFNAMASTLRWVETYLPKRLVQRLMLQEGGVASEEREVTVMFTDIVGFTSLSEHRPARELADMLNEHFSLIARCIEAEGGTLDKYIGDSAMAFWNAPDRQPDHAARACRAAIAIAEAMRDSAKRRRAAGLPVLRMRLGLHTGPAIVGNIGAPGRVNYTIVGDTVNTAQRLQGLGRRFDDGTAPAIALASETTARAADGVVPMVELGLRGVAGREKPITVFRLA
ncbi:MAG: adenylate/guanylate cyclase domain-containing protein [Alphaproteobacteria bacterium]|nr:adenylate/guanylate cyclase domain-containing protein [Alphaproteobacteria bacterium]